MSFTLGVFSAETYLYHHDDEALNFNHVDDRKSLPSVASCLVCLLVSSSFYLFIAWGMPFDWIFPNESFEELYGRPDDNVVYPCDDEMEGVVDGDGSSGSECLSVQDIYHVYPDGTQAVKGISFKVQKGEVLSYLGANGAGKR